MSNYDQRGGNPEGTQVVARDNSQRSRLLRRKIELLVIDGPDRGRKVITDKSPIRIGTSDRCQLTLTDNTASRNHCEISITPDGYLFKDLGSTNGSFLNDVRLMEAYIPPGALFTLGQSAVRFRPLEEQVIVDIYPKDQFGPLWGKSYRMREIFQIMFKIAPTEATVLIEGETGTGKELAAEALHSHSNRVDGPFVVFDCGAVPKELAESELFGHEKGAFTGATQARKGLFEAAQGGTIFLDELGELRQDLQPKLLRVLEKREVRRVGSNKAIPVDVRILAATNRDLEAEVSAGNFREDLYHRLAVINVILPPLRERVEDIPLLAQRFYEGMGMQGALSSDVVSQICRHRWPGNVRELKNYIERMVFLNKVPDLPDIREIEEDSSSSGSRGSIDIFADLLEDEIPFSDARQQVLARFEREYLVRLLQRHGGNVLRSARAAKVDRRYLQRLKLRYGITVDRE
jgi:transcriptional regulator with GAF, ATPase, and Fis domain